MQTSALSDASLAQLLAADVPYGDLTTETLGIGLRPARLSFRARQAMTVCAVEEAARLFHLAGTGARVLTPSGSTVAAGTVLLEATAPAILLHRGYKTAQVLVEWASGIASAAAAIVAAAGGIPVACTRKHVPGTKSLSTKAVKAGGATMHRLGLSETLLIFAEHRLFLDESEADTISRLRKAQPEKKIVVEVENLEEAQRWAVAGADVLQLERFTVESVAACRRFVDRDFPRIRLAPTGGINAGNAAGYAASGADLLVTSAPYLASPCDVKVTFGQA